MIKYKLVGTFAEDGVEKEAITIEVESTSVPELLSLFFAQVALYYREATEFGTSEVVNALGQMLADEMDLYRGRVDYEGEFMLQMYRTPE